MAEQRASEKHVDGDKPETVVAGADARTGQAKANEKGGFATYLRIFSYSERLDYVLIAVSFVAAAGSGASLSLVQLIFGNVVGIISDFTQGKSSPAEFRSGINKYVLYFVYLFIGRFVLIYTHTALLTIVGTRVTRKIRINFLQSTLSQEISYFDRGDSGSVSVLATTNGNLIQQGICDKLGFTVQAVSTLIVAIIIALVTQWKLTLITITIAPVIIIVIGTVIGMDVKVEAKLLDLYAKAGTLAEDVISSVRSVQAFWMRPKLVKKYDEYLEKADHISKIRSPIYGILFSTEYFLIFCGFSLCFWRGVHMYNAGEISSPGDIVIVLFSVVIATTSLTQISPYFQNFASACSAASELFKIIDRRSSIDPFDESGLRLEKINGELEFKNVDFSYPTRPNVPVLQSFSLVFPARKTTAIVGASGSGKSTIVGLLERWYDINSGTVLIDGQKIEDINISWLRTRIRLVQQEPVLFNGTVFENVCYGLMGSELVNESEEEKMNLVIEACKIANAHEFVSELPEGYATQVGERAGLLSGGQKQRIAIARSIVSNPEILLLDEATSALDPRSEGLVQNALDQAAVNRTTIIIAHKLATVKKADNIIVLSKGSILEQGTHNSLIELDGAYARLVRAQDLSKKAEDAESESEVEDEMAKVRSGLARTNSHVPEAAQKEQQETLDFSKYKEQGVVAVTLRLLGDMKNLRVGLVFVFFNCVVGAATYPAQAILLANIMDVFNLQGQAQLDRGNFWSLMFLVIALGNWIVYFVLGWFCNIVARITQHVYRKKMFDAILRQDAQFFDRAENTTGSLTSRLSSQPTQIRELMGFNLALIVLILVNLISCSVLALVVGWKLGLVVIFGGLPPMVLAGFVRIRLEFKMNKDNDKLFADSAALAGEAIAAIRTVASLALERNILDRYSGGLGDIVSKSIPKTAHTMFWLALTQSIDFLVLALGFWYGCRLVSTGEYTMYQLYVVFIGVFFSGQAAAQFLGFMTSVTKAVSAANYMFWLEGLKPIVAETDRNKNFGPPPDDSDIALDKVNFAYPTRPEAKVLRNIDINIEPGQTVAFVGASGCGKSTMIGMLERFYDPISGRITLGGNDISVMNPRLYRSQIALVQQEPIVYQGSIAENVALGVETTEDVPEELIIDACKQANIYDFVTSLPEGLGTDCGGRGLSLSGGQRQRIAIARALVRDPRVLLLDEATSALDTESEKIVQQALARAAETGRRTTVAVAHRLSTIRDADTICVFLNGRIAEQGTHTELLERGELYAEMCKAQSLDKAV